MSDEVLRGQIIVDMKILPEDTIFNANDHCIYKFYVGPKFKWSEKGVEYKIDDKVLARGLGLLEYEHSYKVNKIREVYIRLYEPHEVEPIQSWYRKATPPSLDYVRKSCDPEPPSGFFNVGEEFHINIEIEPTDRVFNQYKWSIPINLKDTIKVPENVTIEILETDPPATNIIPGTQYIGPIDIHTEWDDLPIDSKEKTETKITCKVIDAPTDDAVIKNSQLNIENANVINSIKPWHKIEGVPLDIKVKKNN